MARGNKQSKTKVRKKKDYLASTSQTAIAKKANATAVMMRGARKMACRSTGKPKSTGSAAANSYVHQQWTVVNDEEHAELIVRAGGTCVTDDNFRVLAQANPQMKCLHCPKTLKWNPSTNRAKHLFRCTGFASHPAWHGAVFQKDMSAHISAEALKKQASNLKKHCGKLAKFTKGQQASASELLTRGLVQCNVAPTLLESEPFKQFQRKLSGGAYDPLTRYHFFKVVDDLEARAATIIRDALEAAPCFCLEEDAWSHSNRKFAALTGGGPGQCMFVGGYSNTDSEAATSQAHHIYMTVMKALNLDASVDPNDSSIPLAKVANLTTDTPNVMKKTAEILAKDYRLFRGLLWTACLCHVLNLYLVKQYEETRSVKAALTKAKCVVGVFASGGTHKLFTKYTHDERSKLSAPVITRWGTHVDMARSLVKYKSELKATIADPVFADCAKSSRTDKQSESEAELVDLTAVLGGDMDQCHSDMPVEVSRNKRFHCAYTAIKNPVFWLCMEEYIKLNDPLAQAITFLSGDSVYLSDACLKMFQLNEFINGLDGLEFSNLLTVGELVDLQVLWDKRYSENVRGHHHLALLTDPREHMRDFVAKNESIIGSKEKGTYGNTEFIQSADKALGSLADVSVPDDDPMFLVAHSKLVADAQKKGETLPTNVVIKQQRLSKELKVWLGTHTKFKRSHLGIESRKLDQCTADSDCMDFWNTDVPADKCWLRRSALRVMCAKPTSTAVERLWSHFRDVFSAKRRSMISPTLQKLIYVKVNMKLVAHDALPVELSFDITKSVVNDDWVSDIVEAAEQHELELSKEQAQAAAEKPINVDGSADEGDGSDDECEEVEDRKSVV